MLKRIKNKNKKKQGQSTVEYIILVAAVLAVIIIFLGPNGLFQNNLNSMLKQTTNDMNEMTSILFDHPPE